ncbi:MAG TPA: hypothetical protein VN803_07110 [Gemmatimonadales bacterium]|nr:hypothetical protein [Gemmatimonadales bacterium]
MSRPKKRNRQQNQDANRRRVEEERESNRGSRERDSLRNRE